MKALTLWPEWVWAVLHLGKRVENRGFQFPASLIRKTVALHAGKHVGGRPGAVAYREGLECLVIMATRADWKVSGWTNTGVPVVEFSKDGVVVRTDTTPIVTSAVVGTFCMDYRVQHGDCGHPGWKVPDAFWWPILNLEALPVPVDCKGAQGFWDLPEDVLARLKIERKS